MPPESNEDGLPVFLLSIIMFFLAILFLLTGNYN